RFYFFGPETNKGRKILGDAQFQFLEEKFQHDLPYTILCSGLTFRGGNENWSHFPNDFQRLSNLLKSKDNVLFLAGDIHKNKFYPPSHARPCYEIISSGLAVNYLGLPFEFDNKHNWGMLEIDEQGIDVCLVDKKGRRHARRHRIDAVN
ncbi:MAG: hypothetical protein HUJ30_04690, partial [Gammaproteobacteria bacterium]|nr:hypothetical protein [Gammaproteobacteria bacterium]